MGSNFYPFTAARKGNKLVTKGLFSKPPEAKCLSSAELSCISHVEMCTVCIILPSLTILPHTVFQLSCQLAHKGSVTES